MNVLRAVSDQSADKATGRASLLLGIAALHTDDLELSRQSLLNARRHSRFAEQAEHWLNVLNGSHGG